MTSNACEPVSSVVVVGAGGNIGSHVVCHVARFPDLRRITLIDRDRYETRNLISQDITPADVGKPKAAVQGRRLRRIRPDLQIDVIVDDIRNIPLGVLRSDVILACLDSKRARQYVNEYAWRLGVPWIDSGVEAEGLLARVNVYAPELDTPCLECSWSQADYDGLEQSYPCDQARPGEPPPTNAPSSLGALAAARQAIECRKVLDGNWNLSAVGRQVTDDARHHKHYVMEFRRNRQCRFDHGVWDIRKTDWPVNSLTVGRVLELAQSDSGAASAFLVHGKPFVTRLICSDCGRTRRLLRLQGRLRASRLTCRCGGNMAISEFDLVDRLHTSLLPGSVAERLLCQLGFRAGDVLSLESESGDAHYELI